MQHIIKSVPQNKLGFQALYHGGDSLLHCYIPSQNCHTQVKNLDPNKKFLSYYILLYSITRDFVSIQNAVLTP